MSPSSVKSTSAADFKPCKNLLCPFFFSNEKKNFVGVSIKATFWNLHRTNAPCVLEPSKSAKATFLDLRFSKQPRSPVDCAETCSSTISVSRSLIDLVKSDETLTVYC
ncbi:hypothetical protein GOODEAATRI_034666 [Goodea atripinnis]|uniref:Uncharacterized protein n=1 Tax=Goodea atripinnis TaxID=208336 RepID=A0ABV0PA13_9TELE